MIKHTIVYLNCYGNDPIAERCYNYKQEGTRAQAQDAIDDLMSWLPFVDHKVYAEVRWGDYVIWRYSK